MKINTLVKQLQKSIRDDRDQRPLRRVLKMLLSRRKDDQITIEGHDEFVKYWKQVRNRVEERTRKQKQMKCQSLKVE